MEENLIQNPELYWNKRYQNETTTWDIGHAAPPFIRFIDTIVDKNIRILIPGCGNAYEAEYLLKKGFSDITLIDIAPLLVEKLQKRFENTAIKVVCGDFFKLQGSYDLILEQTFFCALNPDLRKDYVEKMHQLLAKPKGKLAGLLFDKIFDKTGPPFGGKKIEYVALFEILFTFVALKAETDSIEPRLGSELWFEAVPN